MMKNIFINVTILTYLNTETYFFHHLRHFKYCLFYNALHYRMRYIHTTVNDCVRMLSLERMSLLVVIKKTAEQGVTLTGRNMNGPPRSVGRPTAHAPGAPTVHVRPPGPTASSVTDNDDDR